MAAIKLYKVDGSPGVRAVYATIASLDLIVEEHDIDLLKGEQFNKDFIKLNILHSVPTLDDDGLVICDSHVINAYLVQKYGKNDALYPSDLHERVLVDQKLAFDLGILFPTLSEIDDAYQSKEISLLTSKMIEKVKTAYGYLGKMLENKKWVALDRVTIADFSCFATVTSLDYHVPITSPIIINWMNRCKKLACFSNDPEKLQDFKNFIDYVKSSV
ncbi:hypothetical protein FQR65_LT05823 [Abscondita terminalis]|nr:hypothetical protein FQR65_LT05823 [Abscondita terminalis]